MTLDSDDPRHARFREALALALYDELDPDERPALDAHLAGCDQCRALADELRQGLGRVGRGAPADELPPGWMERLRQQGPRQPVLQVLPSLAAAFAAGLFVAVLLLRAPPLSTLSSPASPADSAEPTAAAPFEADAPPPPALRRSRPGWLMAALAR